MLNSGNTCRIDGFSKKSDKDTNYKEHKDTLKLWYSKAPLVNMLNKEGLHKGSATYTSWLLNQLLVLPGLPLAKHFSKA